MDGIVGVSAGALFGVNYPSRQIGRVIRYNKRFSPDKNYIGLWPLLKEGNIVSTQFAYNEVPRKLDVFDDEAFRASGIPFYAVVTNLQTGEGEYLLLESVFEQMDILRASGSMPFVSRPVLWQGKRYLDGAIADSIPYRWMAEQGYEKVTGEYIPTAKNAMVKDLYEKMGFARVGENCFEADVLNFKYHKTFITEE